MVKDNETLRVVEEDLKNILNKMSEHPDRLDAILKDLGYERKNKGDRMLFVGDVVEINTAMLGCMPGAIGVVYEEYDIGGGAGASVILENGAYDGFSPEEQRMFLKKIGKCDAVKGYVFKNVIRLEQDFQQGFFKPGFKK